MNGSKIPWRILEDIRAAGGRPVIVGGSVRDMLLEAQGRQSRCFPTNLGISTSVLEHSKDLDIEVFGLSVESLQNVLEGHGTVDLVGKSFGVLKLHARPDVDFSVPRMDNKVGVGHRGFDVTVSPSLTFRDAARRRDLTINSLGFDPFDMTITDPFHGVDDLRAGVLRATDPDTFLEDPLRALRVAQFVSRFEMVPDAQLVGLCNKADLSELPGERLFEEFNKLLLGRNPGMGLSFLYGAGLLRFFPELHALVGVVQDPLWHPEGDVWVHTIMAVDAARKLTDDPTVLWAVLLHDLGKPCTTEFKAGHWRAHGHEQAGVEPARAFLGRLKASHDLISAVCVLVDNHLAPPTYYKAKAGPGAFRRLARRLGSVSLSTLELVSRADQWGRTTPDAVAKLFPAGEWFLEQAAKVGVQSKAESDVVQGRHLIDRGMKPGPEFGPLLTRCREYQYETGEKDPSKILDAVLTT